MSLPTRRASDKVLAPWRTLGDILIRGDITFAAVVLGLSMILWGVLGLFYQPDLHWFAQDFTVSVPPWMWGINHMACGLGFVVVALQGFPPGRSLLLGTYCITCWTWIAIGRPVASFSSGMTLNFVVIFMGATLVQRSGRQ